MTCDHKWRPFADNAIARSRAELYSSIRLFMSDRHILEVDTPILSRHGISDPFIDSIRAEAPLAGLSPLYLHTSPEFCMKRLLASGIGDCYQIAHVFRDGEKGKRHTLEFVMLEWYRLRFDYHKLIDELGELLAFLGLDKPSKKTYSDIFKQTFDIDPVSIEIEQLRTLAKDAGWYNASDQRHSLLDFLFSHEVIKQIKKEKSLIIYDYPACMASLARLNKENPNVCERFELFIDGMEIANGFTELTDSDEQRQRFEKDLEERKDNKMHSPPIDNHLLDALKHGLPDCAGVALGLDRLLMVLTGKQTINEVNNFTLENN